jgi:phosphatidylserine/phosphatidylglycerophosphate/cardiolipin synthase-like enzyme
MPAPLAVCFSLSLVVTVTGAACRPSIGEGGAARGERGAAAPVRVLIQPDAGADAVLALLGTARRAVWMEMYLLTDAAAIDALVARRRAGCDVRVILEPHPYQADGANDAAYAALAAGGVSVRWASPRFALTHAKVATLDHERLLVLTLNLTHAGLGGNREYVAVDDDAADVVAAERVIAADLTGSDETPGGRLIASPGGSRPTLEALIGGAGRTLSVEMEELSDRALVDALANAAGRGVTVNVALPSVGMSAGTRSAARQLAASGATVRLTATPTLHAKAIVADSGRLYVGSANLTTASLDANRELGLVTEGEAVAQAVEAVMASDLASGTAPPPP